MTMTAQGIIIQYGQGMGSSPSGYSGRGNNYGDLNSKILESIYQGINREIGYEAARAFVNMVAEMKDDASATTFLIALYNLEESGWKMGPHIVPSAAYALNEAIARTHQTDPTAASVGALFGFMQKRDAVGGGAASITGDFLKRHLYEARDGHQPRQMGTGVEPDKWAYE